MRSSENEGGGFVKPMIKHCCKVVLTVAEAGDQMIDDGKEFSKLYRRL